MVPLAGVIIAFIRNTDATSDRLSLSHDAQISAAYFARDVASAGLRDYTAPPDANGSPAYLSSIQLNASYDAGGQVCGTPATPAAAIRFLGDDWDSTGATPVRRTVIVAYLLVPATGGLSDLHRIRCVGSTTPAFDLIVAGDVDPATMAVSCSTPCTAATVPQQVTLTFSVTRPSVGAYRIVLTGQRRQT
jgi:hypothetical protein